VKPFPFQRGRIPVKFWIEFGPPLELPTHGIKKRMAVIAGRQGDRFFSAGSAAAEKFCGSALSDNSTTAGLPPRFLVTERDFNAATRKVGTQAQVLDASVGQSFQLDPADNAVPNGLGLVRIGVAQHADGHFLPGCRCVG